MSLVLFSLELFPPLFFPQAFFPCLLIQNQEKRDPVLCLVFCFSTLFLKITRLQINLQEVLSSLDKIVLLNANQEYLSLEIIQRVLMMASQQNPGDEEQSLRECEAYVQKHNIQQILRDCIVQVNNNNNAD